MHPSFKTLEKKTLNAAKIYEKIFSDLQISSWVISFKFWVNLELG